MIVAFTGSSDTKQEILKNLQAADSLSPPLPPLILRKTKTLVVLGFR